MHKTAKTLNGYMYKTGCMPKYYKCLIKLLRRHPSQFRRFAFLNLRATTDGKDFL